MYQPGEQWLYNSSAQVLGVLLARACGQDLKSVLRERIFEPLGMTDTEFTVPTEQLSRLTTAYQPDRETGELSVLDDAAPQLVEHTDDVSRCVRMARLHDRRLLVVRLHVAGGRRGAG